MSDLPVNCSNQCVHYIMIPLKLVINWHACVYVYMHACVSMRVHVCMCACMCVCDLVSTDESPFVDQYKKGVCLH